MGYTGAAGQGLSNTGVGDVLIKAHTSTLTKKLFLGATFNGIAGLVLTPNSRAGFGGQASPNYALDTTGGGHFTSSMTVDGGDYGNSLAFSTITTGIVISSESSQALGAGVRVSTNVYIVGFSSAAKYYGDGSALTGIAGDNLGNHTATQVLQMGGYGITSNSDINAARYLIAGTTVLANLTGTDSFAVGKNAGRNNTGISNTYIGSFAGYFDTTGLGNSFVGTSAGYSGTSGMYNTYLGAGAGYYNVTGSANVALGSLAGSGAASQSFSSNTLVGHGAGYQLTTGSENVLLGYMSGNPLTAGSRNIIIGSNLTTQSLASNNELNIGGVLFGDMAARTIGISTRVPQAPAMRTISGTDSAASVPCSTMRPVPRAPCWTNSADASSRRG